MIAYKKSYSWTSATRSAMLGTRHIYKTINIDSTSYDIPKDFF